MKFSSNLKGEKAEMGLFFFTVKSLWNAVLPMEGTVETGGV